LGNDILGDDAVGLVACRELGKRFQEQIDFVEAPVAGFALLDYLAGYKKVLILDSIVVPPNKVGSVRELAVDDFRDQSFSSPHFVGLNDVIQLASRLQIDFPSEIRILAMTICDPFVLREGLTLAIQTQMTRFVNDAERILRSWIPAVLVR
jgi:hydrogenase maturation protease